MKGSSGITKLIRLYVKDQHYLKKALMKLCPRLLTRILFYRTMGYWPDIDHPETFNEKIQWFKFHVRDPRITRCADKLAVRAYVAEKVGGSVSDSSAWRI